MVIGPLILEKLVGSNSLINEIYEGFQADYTVQGSVRSSENIIKTSIKLIESSSSTITWSKTITSAISSSVSIKLVIEIIKLAIEAIRLDENSIDARRTLGWLYLYQKN